MYVANRLGRLDQNLHLTKLFQVDIKPLYDPLSFASPVYEPIFNPWLHINQYQSYVFSQDEVRVTCQGLPECEYDFVLTGRREFGLDTLDFQKKFERIKERGERKGFTQGCF